MSLVSIRNYCDFILRGEQLCFRKIQHVSIFQSEVSNFGDSLSRRTILRLLPHTLSTEIREAAHRINRRNS